MVKTGCFFTVGIIINQLVAVFDAAFIHVFFFPKTIRWCSKHARILTSSFKAEHNTTASSSMSRSRIFCPLLGRLSQWGCTYCLGDHGRALISVLWGGVRYSYCKTTSRFYRMGRTRIMLLCGFYLYTELYVVSGEKSIDYPAQGNPSYTFRCRWSQLLKAPATIIVCVRYVCLVALD